MYLVDKVISLFPFGLVLVRQSKNAKLVSIFGFVEIARIFFRRFFNYEPNDSKDGDYNDYRRDNRCDNWI